MQSIQKQLFFSKENANLGLQRPQEKSVLLSLCPRESIFLQNFKGHFSVLETKINEILLYVFFFHNADFYHTHFLQTYSKERGIVFVISEKYLPFILNWIQSKKTLTLANTPGFLGWAQEAPQVAMPYRTMSTY